MPESIAPPAAPAPGRPADLATRALRELVTRGVTEDQLMRRLRVGRRRIRQLARGRPLSFSQRIWLAAYFSERLALSDDDPAHEALIAEGIDGVVRAARGGDAFPGSRESAPGMLEGFVEIELNAIVRDVLEDVRLQGSARESIAPDA